MYWLFFALVLGAQAQHLVNSKNIKGEYDFIVVGMGGSGCVVAGRLTQAGYSVLGVEAGLDWTFTSSSLAGTQWGSWQIFADPQPGRPAGLRQDIEIGKTAGGSYQLSNNGWEWGMRDWANRNAAT